MRIDRHILTQAAFFGFCLLGTALRPVADHQVDPTLLRRWAPEIPEKPADVSSNTCHYKPIFGIGDSQTGIVKGVARFGEMLVNPGGASAIVNYPGEEQVYVFLEGSGTLLYSSARMISSICHLESSMEFLPLRTKLVASLSWVSKFQPISPCPFQKSLWSPISTKCPGRWLRGILRRSFINS